MKILTLTRRELAAYFVTPMAYVVLTPLLFISGVVFFYFIFAPIARAGVEIEMRHVMGILNFLAMFVAPLMTMRLLAEEKKSGTFEMLVTAPVSDTAIVLAKYAAAVVLWIFFLLPSLVYAWILSKYGASPDVGKIICNYIGLVLLVGVFFALGIFFSSLTANQIIAGIASFITLFILYIVGQVQPGWTTKIRDYTIEWNEVFKFASLFTHYQNFEKGVYDTRDIVLFMSLILFFLFLTVKVLESRRWR